MAKLLTFWRSLQHAPGSKSTASRSLTFDRPTFVRPFNGSLYFESLVCFAYFESLYLMSRGGGTRTRNRWFWKPVLYQLSYTPESYPPTVMLTVLIAMMHDDMIYDDLVANN